MSDDIGIREADAWRGRSAAPAPEPRVSRLPPKRSDNANRHGAIEHVGRAIHHLSQAQGMLKASRTPRVELASATALKAMQLLNELLKGS